MTTAEPVTNIKDLTPEEKAYVAKHFPGIRTAPMPKSFHRQKPTSQAKSKPKSGTPGKFRQAISRPWYHIILWILVGFFAYIYLGVGWILGHIAEACSDGGHWLHEYKWRLGK